MITNDDELNVVMMDIAFDLMNHIRVKIEELLKQHIMDDVYGAGTPTVYERSYEFLNSVDDTELNTMRNGYGTTIYHNTDMMESVPEIFKHGSLRFSGGTDARQWLPELLNEGRVGHLFGTGWWTEARPYFDNTIAEIESSGLVYEWCSEFFNSIGIELL